MSVSAKQWFKYVANTCTEEQARKMLVESGIQFRVGTEWAKMDENGQIVNKDGNPIVANLGQVTMFQYGEASSPAVNSEPQLKSPMPGVRPAEAARQPDPSVLQGQPDSTTSPSNQVAGGKEQDELGTEGAQNQEMQAQSKAQKEKEERERAGRLPPARR